MDGARKGLNSLGRVKDLVSMTEAVQAAREALVKEEEAVRKQRSSEKDYNLTTKDVARMFGVHPKTVDRWRGRLGLPFKKFGRSVRFRLGDVLRWAAQRKEG